MGHRQTPRLHRDEKARWGGETGDGVLSVLEPELTHMVFKEHVVLFLPLALTRRRSYGRLWVCTPGFTL